MKRMATFGLAGFFCLCLFIPLVLCPIMTVTRDTIIIGLEKNRIKLDCCGVKTTLSQGSQRTKVHSSAASRLDDILKLDGIQFWSWSHSVVGNSFHPQRPHSSDLQRVYESSPTASRSFQGDPFLLSRRYMYLIDSVSVNACMLTIRSGSKIWLWQAVRQHRCVQEHVTLLVWSYPTRQLSEKIQIRFLHTSAF